MNSGSNLRSCRKQWLLRHRLCCWGKFQSHDLLLVIQVSLHLTSMPWIMIDKEKEKIQAMRWWFMGDIRLGEAIRGRKKKVERNKRWLHDMQKSVSSICQVHGHVWRGMISDKFERLLRPLSVGEESQDLFIKVLQTLRNKHIFFRKRQWRGNLWLTRWVVSPAGRLKARRKKLFVTVKIRLGK